MEADSQARHDLSLHRFSSGERRLRPVLEDIQRYAPEAKDVLDIGSGDGGLLRLIAKGRPGLRGLGVDFSPHNASAPSNGIEVVAADYRHWKAPRQFDLVVAYGVFYVIEMPDDALVAKLASEVAPGGHLIFDLTSKTFGNRVKIAGRSILRAMRGPLLDWAIAKVGAAVYRGRDSAEFIRERVAYMYVTPCRFAGDFAVALERAGFEKLAETPAPLQSFAELSSVRMVFRKRPK